MALNQIFAPTQGKTRPRVVASGVVAGTPLLLGGEPAVALTDRGDATKTITPTGTNVTSLTYKSGAVGYGPTEAGVAYDGTFEFPVAAVTTSTDSGVAVYITAGGALNLTASGNTLFGYTDYPKGYTKENGRAPVAIGVRK
jgi:hypothetical protein